MLYVHDFPPVYIIQTSRNPAVIVLVGENDAFIGDCGKRASFLSHIADSDDEMDQQSCYKELVSLLNSCAATIVCASRGHVSGGTGLEILMSCDYRVISSSVELGGDQDLSMTLLSHATMSRTRRKKKLSALSRLLDGESVSASEARDIGLVDEVISDPSILEDVAVQVGLKNKKRVHYARDSHFKKLLYYIPEQYLVFRSSQLFELIRDFPASEPMLEELRAALRLTSQFDYVIAAINGQLSDRLLIPGAHTEDVLAMYLLTYKVVAFLFRDVPNVRLIDVFRRIATPVIDQLQKRTDSVKCIVSTLLDDDSDATLSLDDEIEDDGLEGAAVRQEDTMALLIGVYGGQESFLSEYRDMLAARLVAIGSFEIDREVASLDLMKSKFSDSVAVSDALAHCAVMIKDIVESKKLNMKLRAQRGGKKIPVSTVVKSGHFWPSNSNRIELGFGESGIDQFSFLPTELQSAMREFEQEYTKLKPTQRVEWCKSEGLVTLSVTINGKETEFKLSPMYVEVLGMFTDLGLARSAPPSTVPGPAPIGHAGAKIFSVEEISQNVKLPIDQVRPVVQFWVSKNVLREVQINQFTIIE